MSPSYRVPAQTASAELREKGSRFLAIVARVGSPCEATARVAELEQRYRDASHVCWAWRVGAPPEPRERCADAGEPSGTAGRPILRALRSFEATDALAAVVRWFGGTKLGRGGLVRAYGGAARFALDEVIWEERFEITLYRVEAEYARSGDLQRLVRPPLVELVAPSYGVTIRGQLRVRRGLESEVTAELDRLGVVWEEAPAR